MYSIRFLLVVLGRSELFTDHTTRAVYPVLSGRASTRALVRLWALIYAGIWREARVLQKFMTVIGPALDVIDSAVLGAIGRPVTLHP
jgi:formate-nitrite transporter family protein